MAYIPAETNLKLYIGATFFYDFQWVEKNNKDESVPHELPGYSGIMSITPVGSHKPWRTVTTSEKISVTGSEMKINSPEGTVEIIIDPEITQRVQWSRAKFQILLTRYESKFEKTIEVTYPVIIGEISASNYAVS